MEAFSQSGSCVGSVERSIEGNVERSMGGSMARGAKRVWTRVWKGVWQGVQKGVEQVHRQWVTTRQAVTIFPGVGSLCSKFYFFYEIYFLPPMLTMYPALSLQRISRWQHTRLNQMTPSLISTHLKFHRERSTLSFWQWSNSKFLPLIV